MPLNKRPTKLGLLAAGALALTLLIGACSNGSAGSNGNDINALSQLVSGMSDTQLEALARGAAIGTTSTVNGIQATGVGTVDVKPDIAVISLGVDTVASTVTDARDAAATAVDAMLTSLRSNGVADADMTTQYYNIQPKYTYDQVTDTLDNGQKVTRSQQHLVGYEVTNTLSVKVRNLDKIGEIVDGAVTAGGDATRINSIDFTLEDPSSALAQARGAALADALAKANLYAQKLDATRGKLVSVVETIAPQNPTMKGAPLAADAAGGTSVPTTSLLSGNLQVSVTIQAVFAIE